MIDPPQDFKRYPILVTYHARQRWLERVVDPANYSHIRKCHFGRSCGICVQLIQQIRDIASYKRQNFDRIISGRALSAIRNNERAEDPLFLNAIMKWWPEDGTGQEHYYDRQGRNTIIFAIKREPDGRPVVVTVLTQDMIDGTVLMANQDNTKRVFQAWKRQAKKNV